jgi:hypothetical protein
MQQRRHLTHERGSDDRVMMPHGNSTGYPPDTKATPAPPLYARRDRACSNNAVGGRAGLFGTFVARPGHTFVAVWRPDVMNVRRSGAGHQRQSCRARPCRCRTQSAAHPSAGSCKRLTPTGVTEPNQDAPGSPRAHRPAQRDGTRLLFLSGRVPPSAPCVPSNTQLIPAAAFRCGIFFPYLILNSERRFLSQLPVHDRF